MTEKAFNREISGIPLIFFYVDIKPQDKNRCARKRQNLLELMNISDLFPDNYLKSYFNSEFTLDNKNNIVLVYISRRNY